MDIQNSRNRGGVSSETREESLVVFLSFKARDTFVDDLYENLLRAGILVFIDEEGLAEGEEIGLPLTQAIRQSKIAIPILSKDYLSSKRCLQELVQMVECGKKTSQIIMPVFFNVEPFVEKKESHDYGEAIAGHRQKGIDSKTLLEWEEALLHVGSMAGLLSNRSGADASLIDELVANVLREQNRYLVDIEHHVQRVIKLLDVESSDFRVVGIHGKGGAGKTTIAKLVYKRMSRLFDGFSFLESVRENEETQGGLKTLRDQLISDLLGDQRKEYKKIKSFRGWTNLIQTEFFNKKFLIVVDDVGASFQHEKFLQIRKRKWLSPGSRIIIITRAKQALAELDRSQKHVVEGMQEGETLQLFHTHAFRGTLVPCDYAPLSKQIVSNIGPLPLVVEVVGSYLYSKSNDVWKQTLGKLQKVDEVQQKLTVIIDTLPFEQRRIFLDIACFFVGEDESVACYLWSDHDSAGGSKLKVLVDLSIVKVENGKLWMHNQLQDLGRDIVRQNQPESRSWSHRQALDVLRGKKGEERVEGVILKFGSRLIQNFGPTHFAGMSKIRILRLGQANLEGNFEGHLSSLRWLRWQGCPQNLHAKNLDLKELVILDLSRSNISEKWIGWNQIQKSEKLKVLNLTGCVNLTRTPDLSHFTCLERLILERCMWLDEMGPSVKSLQCLISLNLKFCIKLKKLPHELGSLTSLEVILIDETAVQKIPSSIGDLQKLKRFSACNCLSLTQLPESISHVESLEVLTLNGTEKTELPLSGKLGVLQYLSISKCRLILSLPTSMETLTSLSELDISSTGINELPDTVKKLSLLKVLKIDSTFVRKLPPAIWELNMLEELHASGCRSLKGEIPEEIKMLSALRVLKLGYSLICGLPDSISELPNLQTLDVLHCDKLPEVPKLPSSLISLSVSSKLMDRIPDISSLVKLGELFLGDVSQELVSPVLDHIKEKECTLQLGSLSELKILQLSALKIQLLPVGLHYLFKLRKLSLCCIHLKKLPPLPPGLFTLSLRHYKLQTMPDLSYLVLLSEFELFNCAVTEVPGLGKFKSLRVFTVSHCDLRQVNELENLIFLASLNISHCQSLERLPDQSKLKMLKDVKIEGHQKIRVDFDGVDYHRFLSEERSGSITDADSSSESESSRRAKTKHSSFKGIEPIYEGNEGRIDGSIGKIDLSSGKIIGEGSNGTIVVEGRHEERPAAVKCVGQVYCHVADNEINILKKTGPYKNIVGFYGVERGRDFVYLALELCTCSLDDLFQAYSNSSNNPRSLTKNKKINNPRSPDGPASKKDYESKLASVRNTMQDVDLQWVVGHRSTSLLKLMRDVVKGLSQLHSLGIIHLDLNPTNILITKNPFGAKLSGMGTSISPPHGQSSSGSHATSCGTKGWQAPELFRDGGCPTQAMDLFSLGCVLFFCVTPGRHPFNENIASSNPKLSFVKNKPEAYDLFSRLLSQDPESRPKASVVLHHPFFWSSDMRLNFFRAISDRIKVLEDEGKKEFPEAVEDTAKSIFKGTYDSRSVKGVLRGMRNDISHHQENFQLPDDLDAQFAQRFPRLLIELYKVASKFYKDDDYLKKYFLFGELK